MPAVAGSGHSSPGGWRGLNCRMASALIRNAGNRLVPFSKELFPLFSFFSGGAGAMGKGFHNYLLVHLLGDSPICSHPSDHSWKVHPVRNVFLGAEVPPLSSLPPCPSELL